MGLHDASHYWWAIHPIMTEISANRAQWQQMGDANHSSIIQWCYLGGCIQSESEHSKLIKRRQRHDRIPGVDLSGIITPYIYPVTVKMVFCIISLLETGMMETWIMESFEGWWSLSAVSDDRNIVVTVQ